jgi:hypothetical protein
MKNKVLIGFVPLIFFCLNVQAQIKTGSDKKIITDIYPDSIGHLCFKSTKISFNNIKNTETRSDTFKIFNDWEHTMTISTSKLPEYITCKLIPDKQLKPKQKGIILVTYDAAKRNDWGYVNDRFWLITNDSVQPEKPVGLSANIVEDHNYSPEQLANSPVIKLKNRTLDFDTITAGEIFKYDFEFSNEGKSDLIIIKTNTGCGCDFAEVTNKRLKPGDSGIIHYELSTEGHNGAFGGTIYIKSNDLLNPWFYIKIHGYIKKK